MDKHRTLIKIILGLLIFALAIFAVYISVEKIMPYLIPTADIEDTPENKTVVKDGKEYYPRQDISVFLLMGIDRSGKVMPSTSYNNSGAADVISLAVFDDTNKTFNVLMLNRDTMADITVLGVDGSPADTIKAQLALSHTYGTGVEDSCENVKRAVSDLLGGIHIDYYISMNMDVVSILNDTVGGVTVNVTDDFSEIDSSIPKGEVTLKGDQALSFVRNRKGVGDQLNLSRMERQTQFIEGFMKAVDKKAEQNDAVALEIYNSISEYVVSDCPMSTFDGIIDRVSEYTLSDVIKPEGENKKGQEYMEFYVDESALEDIAIRLFYSEKPEYKE